MRGFKAKSVIDGDIEITRDNGEHELKVQNGIQVPCFFYFDDYGVSRQYSGGKEFSIIIFGSKKN